LIAVSYDRASALRSTAAIAAREKGLGTNLVREFNFTHTGVVTRVLSVAPEKAAGVVSALRAQPGVVNVGTTGARRYPSAVSKPYFPNDPYFNGFTAVQNAAARNPAPSTFQIQPYSESAAVPGQWGMHAAKFEYAFGYSQPGNGSGIVNAGALGSSAVKIAIIDTGEDNSHPELTGKIAYQKCFITAPDNTQSTSSFSTDLNGHGTNVAGIAAASLGNGLGFAGAGGNASIYAYRVFPAPDDNCAGSATDAQCGANSNDIASAIEDAVTAGVNVINISLGGDSCTNGVDNDIIEGNAVADALAANIVVVAAAGNRDAGPFVEAPACITNVIAVGASALADGQPNGAGNSNGSAGTFEYLASYSDYGTPGAAFGSASAWGILAPGGDAVDRYDADELHWIANTWTSTPLDSGFAGACGADYPSLGASPADCQAELNGTSMAAPLVAGAAALILAVNPSYQSSAGMKQLLCTTADDISDPNEGCGRLNVYRAMATALGDQSPP
jgi:subtilisin family serine protease